jgi:putative transposase
MEEEMGEIPESLTQMSGEQRREAMSRFEIIRGYVEGDVSQVELAQSYQVPVKTVQRWVARYRAYGLRGLSRLPRSDRV